MGIDILSNFKDIKLSEYQLTPRMLKGYNFERLVNKELKNFGFTWSWTEGLGYGEGTDFYHKEYPIQIEAKFSHAVIYPCWIQRDWISRFDNVKYKIVVTNRGIKLGERAKELLKKHNIIHVYFDQLRALVQWIIFLMKGVTSSRTTIYYSLMSYCTNTVSDSTYYDITCKNKRRKTRLRHDLFQTSLDPCADDRIILLAYILGVTNLFHTTKHTPLNDPSLSTGRILTPLTRTQSTYAYYMGRIDTMRNSLIPYNLTTFTLSPFRISKYEPFPIPFKNTKETLQKHLSTPSVFAESLSLLSPMETIFGSLTYSETDTLRPDQVDLHGNIGKFWINMILNSLAFCQ
jgi:hypothetical protein